MSRQGSRGNPWTTDNLWKAKPEDTIAAEELGMIWDSTPDEVWIRSEKDKKLKEMPPIAMPDRIRFPITTRKAYETIYKSSTKTREFYAKLDPTWKERLKSLTLAGIKGKSVHIRGENNGSYPYPRVILDCKGGLSKERRERIREIIVRIYPDAGVIFRKKIYSNYCTSTHFLRTDEFIAAQALNRLAPMVRSHDQILAGKRGKGIWLAK